MKGVLENLERQLALFPIAVVLLATGGFLFGGHCAAWQWYAAFALTAALPLAWRSPRREALVATALFAAVWIGVLFVSPLLTDPTHGDYTNYHFPVIRLLAEGWNPVGDSELSKILAATGLEKDGMGYLHVAFIARVAAVFNAVAYLFHTDHFAISFPFLYFMFALLTCTALRCFGRRLWSAAVLLLLFTWHFLEFDRFVDGGAYLASVGLLLVIYKSLADRKTDWLMMASYAFWMATLKIPSALAAVVFCGIYALIVLFRSARGERFGLLLKFFLMGVVLAVSFAVASFNPYGTSYRDYGHPLYPFMTVDEQKFPAHDLTGDFKVGNDDFHAMGYVGLMANAYVSPDLAKWYYCRKLNKKEFHPHSCPWSYNVCQDAESPVTSGRRYTLWLALAILLAVPRLRVFGVMMFISFWLLPKQHIGYLRYMPWMDAFRVFAVVGVYVFFIEKLPRLRLWGEAGVCFLCVASFFGHLPLKCDTVYNRYNALNETPGEIFVSSEMSGRNNALLLMRKIRPNTVPTIICRTDEELRSLDDTRYGYRIKGRRPAIAIPVRPYGTARYWQNARACADFGYLSRAFNVYFKTLFQRKVNEK